MLHPWDLGILESPWVAEDGEEGTQLQVAALGGLASH